MNNANFTKFSEDYSIFGAICKHFRGTVNRKTWYKIRQGNEIEKYIITDYIGTTFDHLLKIAEHYMINIEIYYKKVLIKDVQVKSDNTLMITRHGRFLIFIFNLFIFLIFKIFAYPFQVPAKTVWRI